MKEAAWKNNRRKKKKIVSALLSIYLRKSKNAEWRRKKASERGKKGGENLQNKSSPTGVRDGRHCAHWEKKQTKDLKLSAELRWANYL